ncbi:cytochrome P450 [Ganoderma leucocontextum]|nr:cytochrome P450 [Ganoderma leucocontextum]
MPYGNWWRRHRRAFWQHFFPASIERHVLVQKKYAQVFMRKLLEDPTRLCDHIRYTFAATVVKITYGVEVADTNDRYISLIEKVLSVVVAFTPGRYLIETFPILQYIPEWVPGAGFQKDFREWRTAAKEVTTSLYREATERGDENAINSVVAELARQVDQEGEEATFSDKLDVVRNVGFTAFEGGADTTVSTLQSFFLAMSLYPEAQRKAQAELDAVIGSDRLPDYSDRAALPYVNAVVKEALRWQPVLAFSLPHMTVEDMEYSGYFIPKGTLLMPNSWACLHDPEAYPEPERFLPDRFMREGKLDPRVRDPTRFAFGYGRRICPGRNFADATLFTNITMILHAFDITPPLDEGGKPIAIEPRMTDTMLWWVSLALRAMDITQDMDHSFPLDCRCTITPRSNKAKELILADDP